MTDKPEEPKPEWSYLLFKLFVSYLGCVAAGTVAASLGAPFLVQLIAQIVVCYLISVNY